MRVDELAGAGSADQRVAGGAADRYVAIAGKDAVVTAGIDDPVIAVLGGEDAAIGREDRQTLIARGCRKDASAAGVGDDLKVEIPRNRRRHIIRIRGDAKIDGLIACENVVMAARYRRHAHPKM